MEKTTRITRQDVAKHPKDLSLEPINIGTGGKHTTVEIVIPLTLKGCQLLLNDKQITKDVCRSLRIRSADDTGARDTFVSAKEPVKQNSDVQSLLDGWDRHSRASRATVTEVSVVDAKDVKSMLAALAAKGINVKLS